MQTIAQLMIMTTLVMSLIAFATSTVTLRKPLHRAAALVCFSIYLGVALMAVDLIIL